MAHDRHEARGDASRQWSADMAAVARDQDRLIEILALTDTLRTNVQVVPPSLRDFLGHDHG